ncbi:microsomal signal peptidase 25 kDa subunit-domain-containing protein [Lophiotrema nucula]|uniref:Signal peptidase complex subunit 2 n=1 Tax=Lophiotrema nucula TaxID=690887 RepID=A0A6A5YQR4_9PLEO|nr:microsomal signal peptidase 25 kDa subunit-domain-containing protein [Lophiotrema nucula]
MSATTKIAVHSLADLKNTTDDALPNYLHFLKFKQIHTQTDVRLALGYSAVAIAGVLFYFDWKFGWEVTKPYTAPAVIAYFVLNSVFSYWLWFVEKGTVYEGEGKTGKVRIATHTKKHIPIYEAEVTFTPSPYNSNPSQTIKIRAPFTRWFTSDGYFIAKPFQQWLASEVPVIGAADPNNVVEEIGRGSETDRSFNVSSNNVADVLEQIKTGAKPAGGSGKRRKA